MKIGVYIDDRIIYHDAGILNVIKTKRDKSYIIVLQYIKDKKYHFVYNERLKGYLKVLNYNAKPVVSKKDNQSTPNYVYKNVTTKNPYIRVPSKKHKNRYKNFLKMFPNFKD